MLLACAMVAIERRIGVGSVAARCRASSSRLTSRAARSSVSVITLLPTAGGAMGFSAVRTAAGPLEASSSMVPACSTVRSSQASTARSLAK